MTTTIKQLYPSTSTTALTITLASLATSSTLLTGRQSTAVDNTTNLDLDHLLTGKIRLGTSPTVSTIIQVWVFAPHTISAGTPTYPDTLGATDAGVSITSDNVKFPMLKLAWSAVVDATTGRDYYIPPTSIASLFGEMPPFWGVWVTHSTAVALDSTAGNHSMNYYRIQKQTV